MTLGLTEFRSIIVTARLGSIGRAARELNISQPALSRRIAEVEASLGTRLFDRLTKGVRPTEACRAFVRHAEIAVVSIEGARDAARSVGSHRHRDVAIGFVDALCDSWFLTACRTTSAQYPDVQLLFRSSAQSAQVSADVLAAEVKLGLRYHCDEDPQLESAWVMDDELVVVCAPSHPLACRDVVTIDELLRAQWLDYPKLENSAGLHVNLTESLLFRGVGKWNSTPLDSLYARIRLVEAGFGVALVRRANIRAQLLEGGLVVVKAPLPHRVPVYVTWRRGAYLGEAAEFLMRCLTEHRSAKN
jgi:DNA-binding transcriptional LysR family regulator